MAVAAQPQQPLFDSPKKEALATLVSPLHEKQREVLRRFKRFINKSTKSFVKSVNAKITLCKAEQESVISKQENDFNSGYDVSLGNDERAETTRQSYIATRNERVATVHAPDFNMTNKLLENIKQESIEFINKMNKWDSIKTQIKNTSINMYNFEFE